MRRIFRRTEGVFCLNKTTITVGSVTYAIKARKLLERMRIHSKLVKIDVSKTSGGCTYGITFDTEDFYSAAMGLRNAGISYQIYSQS